MAASAAAGTSLAEMRGLTVEMENHVAGAVSNGGVGVRGGVVEQPDGVVHGLLGCL